MTAPGLTLTASELIDLTHKRRPTAQVRALKAMSIEYRVRPDGTVAVLRSHVESLFTAPVSAAECFEIDWG